MIKLVDCVCTILLQLLLQLLLRVCAGSDCLTNSDTNSGLSPATIGSTTAALFLVLILSTTVVVVGIAVGIHRRKKQQHNMIR